MEKRSQQARLRDRLVMRWRVLVHRVWCDGLGHNGAPAHPMDDLRGLVPLLGPQILGQNLRTHVRVTAAGTEESTISVYHTTPYPTLA